MPSVDMAATATTTIILEPSVPEKPKRTRKTHHKVRTGCLTCKIRRKKCDEAKPYCKRCTSTGRKCDGYENIDTQPSSIASRDRPPRPAPAASKLDSPDSGIDVSSTRTKSVSKSPPAAIFSSRSDSRSLTPSTDHDFRLFRNPSSTLSLTTNTFSSPEDHYSFSFFQHRTGPEFAAYFDSSIWRSFILRACFQYPTVLAAASAVGAVHRRFELGITPEAFAFCDIADRQYHRATKLLSLDLASNHPAAPEINMLSHLLLAVFETFQGNDDNALSHMTRGLNHIFTRPTITTHRESRYKALQVGYTPLHNFITQLEDLAQTTAFFGTQEPQSPPFTPLSDPALSASPTPMPTIFASLDQARDYLFTESLWIWQAWHSLTLGTNNGSFTLQHNQITRLLQWSMTYAEFTKSDVARRVSSSSTSPTTTHGSSSSKRSKRQAHLLKTYREALYLTLLTQLALHDESSGQAIVPRCFPPESCDCHRSCRDYAERKSALNAHFARLVVLGEGLFDAVADNNSSSSSASSPSSSSTNSSRHSSSTSRTGINAGRSRRQSWPYDSYSYGEHSLNLDTGIGPPLWEGSGGERCRSTKVRHQVVGLLGKERLQGEVWGKMGVYSIAEKLSAVEEHAIVAAGGLKGVGVGVTKETAGFGLGMGLDGGDIASDGSGFGDGSGDTAIAPIRSQMGVALDPEIGVEDINGWFRGQPNWMAGTRGLGDVKWCDYTCFLEEGRLLVRYCQEDELGGLVWTQEWVSFR